MYYTYSFQTIEMYYNCINISHRCRSRSYLISTPFIRLNGNLRIWTLQYSEVRTSKWCPTLRCKPHMWLYTLLFSYFVHECFIDAINSFPHNWLESQLRLQCSFSDTTDKEFILIQLFALYDSCAHTDLKQHIYNDILIWRCNLFVIERNEIYTMLEKVHSLAFSKRIS